MSEKRYVLSLTASRDEIAAAVEKLRGELRPASHGGPAKLQPNAFQRAALALYGQVNQEDLAEKLGVSVHVLRRWWREYGGK